LRFLSLFAGIGGFDLGLERAGFECAGQVEIEPFCRKVLAKHWPNVWRWNDVKTLTGALVAEKCGAIELLCGGVPCQPASVAGKRKGAADDRWLWPDFLRLVSEVNPVWVLAENPRGVLSLPVEGMEFSEWIARQFAARGYELFPIELAAEDVGAPHRRERIFFVGYARGIKHNRLSSIRRQEMAAIRRTSERFANVANADLSQRRPPACEANERNGNDRGRQEAASGSELRREELADANELLHGAGASGQRWGLESSNGCGLGNADNARLAQHASQRSNPRTELAAALGAGWPSRPGQPQNEWEEPRTVESPLGSTVAGVPVRLVRRHRVAALKALGNAIVPQVAEVIGRAILQMEAI